MDDQHYMNIALNMARMVQGQTSPNPPVGAVVVKDGRVIGYGAHLKAGEAHAEVHALEMAGIKAKGATIYVTLEPCSHDGRTAPCVDAILEKGIRRVVIATLDPNEKNHETGVKKLEKAGVTVDVGIMQDEAEEIIKAFGKLMKERRPFVTVKTAVTLDGKTAASVGDSKWITGTKARENAHEYRAHHDAILVGVNTVIHDNPRLTARTGKGGKNPLRIILDTHLRIPPQSNVIADGDAYTWIFTGNGIRANKKKNMERFAHVKVMPLESAAIQLDEVLKTLAINGVMTLFVEGGSGVSGSFLQEKLVDEIIFYVAPKLLGGKHAYPSFGGAGFPMIADAWDVVFKEIGFIGRDLKIIAVPRG